jgi:hypothetical protein
MNRLQGSKRLLWLAALALLISPLLLTLVNGATSRAAYAQANNSAGVVRTITVVGDAAKVKNDLTPFAPIELYDIQGKFVTSPSQDKRGDAGG